MDNVSAILSRKEFDMPPEIGIIQRYAEEHFGVSVGVRVSEKVIVVTARSAALVSKLRMHMVHLQRACATDKKIVLRIS